MKAAAPLWVRRPCQALVESCSGSSTRSSSRGRMAVAPSLRWLPRRFSSTPATRSGPQQLQSSAALTPSYMHAIQGKGGRVRTAFAVYQPAAPVLPQAQPAAKPEAKSEAQPDAKPQTQPSQSTTRPRRLDVLRAYDAQQTARMDPTGARAWLFSRHNPDAARPGDVLLVTPRRAGVEPFAGVCLAIRRGGISGGGGAIETAILLRGQLAKTGVEMWFKIYSRAVAAIDIIQRRPRRARRARLTFMRQPKHDRGSVDDLVRAWRRSRNVLRTRSGGSQSPASTKPKRP